MPIIHMPLPTAAAVILAMGLAAICLAGEAPVVAPQPPANLTLVPLNLLGLKPGQEIRLEDTNLIADAAGLPLPLGTPVKLACKSGNQDEIFTVISVNSATGFMPPTWAADAATRKPDGSIVTIGQAGSALAGFHMMLSRARMEALKQTAEFAGGSTELGIASVEIHLNVIADKTSSPQPLPQPAGGRELTMRDGRRSGQATCWTRITARLPEKPAEAAPKQ
jgi:hypothetical protein